MHSVPVSLPCCSMSVLKTTTLLGFVKKQKNVVSSMATHACYICYAASRRLRPCLLLLPGGALLADRDELSIAESALVGFCVASLVCNYHLVIQPFVQWSIVCTIYCLRNGSVVHTLISLKSLISLFSPFAGEGFTCLDHSMLNKKKIVDAFVVCSQKKTTHEKCNCYAASLSAMVEPDSTFLRSSTCCS